MDGLLEEWNNSRTNDNKISLEAFYEQQALFHSNLKHVLKTPIALFLLEKYGEQTLIDLKERLGYKTFN